MGSIKGKIGDQRNYKSKQSSDWRLELFYNMGKCGSKTDMRNQIERFSKGGQNDEGKLKEELGSKDRGATMTEVPVINVEPDQTPQKAEMQKKTDEGFDAFEAESVTMFEDKATVVEEKPTKKVVDVPVNSKKTAQVAGSIRQTNRTSLTDKTDKPITEQSINSIKECLANLGDSHAFSNFQSFPQSNIQMTVIHKKGAIQAQDKGSQQESKLRDNNAKEDSKIKQSNIKLIKQGANQSGQTASTSPKESSNPTTNAFKKKVAFQDAQEQDQHNEPPLREHQSEHNYLTSGVEA